MKNYVNAAPACAAKAVAPSQTYDFGFGDVTHGYGPGVRNGRIFVKTKRKSIFFNKHNIVKH
jgi:hypothetical protein